MKNKRKIILITLVIVVALIIGALIVMNYLSNKTMNKEG